MFSRGTNRQYIWRLAEVVSHIRGIRAYRLASRESLRRALWDMPDERTDALCVYSPKSRYGYALPPSRRCGAELELRYQREFDPTARIKTVFLFRIPQPDTYAGLWDRNVRPICALCEAEIPQHWYSPYCDKHRRGISHRMSRHGFDRQTAEAAILADYIKAQLKETRA